ncbi:MAG: tRNA lysidine(34) synthetase TilS [Gammaproteobacteria bacterium]
MNGRADPPAASGPPDERGFLERLRSALPGLSEGARYAVAYSGGLDSTVLLAGAARLVDPSRLRALHVDHGLQPDSADWSRHCERVCARLRVPFECLRVHVDIAAGTGVEAAARAARYAALGAQLTPGEILLTAHHADDQLETVLLRMLRGAGVRGLRGILPEADLGAGRVVRPLLELTRAELRAIAALWELEWVEDPSNRSLEFDRNLVRTRLVPIIRERWGDSAAHAATRLTAAMRDAEALLERIARDDLEAAGAVPGRLPLPPLRRLDPERQRNALRYAVRAAGLPVPDAARLEALRRGIGATPAEAARRVEWRGGEARLFRDRFYLLPPRALPARETAHGGFAPFAPGDGQRAASASEHAAPSETQRVAAGLPWHGSEGRIVLEPVGERDRAACGFPESWAREGLDVRFRAGGERFKPAGDAHHRTLKAWFQQRGIVPWMRERIPLLYREGRLVAVADLALDEHARRALPDEPRWRVRWLDHPPIE